MHYLIYKYVRVHINSLSFIILLYNFLQSFQTKEENIEMFRMSFKHFIYIYTYIFHISNLKIQFRFIYGGTKIYAAILIFILFIRCLSRTQNKSMRRIKKLMNRGFFIFLFFYFFFLIFINIRLYLI